MSILEIVGLGVVAASFLGIGLGIRAFRELSQRLDSVARARYEEIENVADVVWALVAHLDLSDDQVSRLVHAGHTSTRKVCPCDSCARWRVDHADYSDSLDHLDHIEHPPSTSPGHRAKEHRWTLTAPHLNEALPVDHPAACPFCLAGAPGIVPVARPDAPDGDVWTCTACGHEWSMQPSTEARMPA